MIDEVNPANGQAKGTGSTSGSISIGSTAMPSAWAQIQPAALPEPVDNSPEAPKLYGWAILGTIGIIAAIVLGSLALAFFDKTTPDGLLNIGIFLAGALGGMLTGQVIAKANAG